MKINNPFALNDWKFSQFIITVFLIQIFVIASVGLRLNGFNIPILGELIAFIYLIFIPGYIILRILRLHNLGNVETLLYAVGFSIGSIMLVGAAMNFIYPFFNISNPISTIHLVTVMTIFVIALSTISYIRDRNFFDHTFIDISNLLVPEFLFLCIIPFLAVLGTYLLNYHHNASISILLILFIGLIVILVAFNRIPKRFYPFTVFIISISLLFHASLISTQIWGYDIQSEYYLASLVLKNFYWNYTINYDVNAMTAIVIFAPGFSQISGMSLTWIFKIIYPFIFSLVPLGLYEIFRKQTNTKIAALSCFFFVFFYIFFTEMQALARQEFAELFIVILVLLMLNSKINKANRYLIFIFFSISLITSHYASAYFYLTLLIGTLILMLLFNFNSNKIFSKPITEINQINYLKKENNINLIHVVIFIILIIVWYYFIASSENFTVVYYIVTNLVGSLLILLNILKIIALLILILFAIFILKLVQSKLIVLLKFVQSKLKSVQTKTGFNEVILLILFLLIPILLVNDITNLFFPMAFILLFIIIGIIIVIFTSYKSKFKKEYIGFSIISSIIIFVAIIYPSFAQILNLTRFYEITFLFLAPFCVIGGIRIYEAIFRTLYFSKEDYSEISIKVFAMFLVLFLFFSTTLTTKFLNQNYFNETIIVFLIPFLAIGISIIPKLFLKSISPDQRNYKLSNILKTFLLIFLIISVLFAYTSGSTNGGGFNINGHEISNKTFIPQEYYSVTWLCETRSSGYIYGDIYGTLILQRFFGAFYDNKQIVFSINNTTQFKNNSYIFVRNTNIKYNKFIVINKLTYKITRIPLDNVTKNTDLIYSNSYSKIYYTNDLNYSLRHDSLNSSLFLDDIFFKQYIIRKFYLNGITITI